MFRVNRHKYGVIRALTAAGLLVIGLVMGSAASVLAGSSGTWSITGSLNIARSRHTATLLPNGKVLVAGGVDAAGNKLNSADQNSLPLTRLAQVVRRVTLALASR